MAVPVPVVASAAPGTSKSASAFAAMVEDLSGGEGATDVAQARTGRPTQAVAVSKPVAGPVSPDSPFAPGAPAAQGTSKFAYPFAALAEEWSAGPDGAGAEQVKTGRPTLAVAFAKPASPVSADNPAVPVPSAARDASKSASSLAALTEEWSAGAGEAGVAQAKTGGLTETKPVATPVPAGDPFASPAEALTRGAGEAGAAQSKTRKPSLAVPVSRFVTSRQVSTNPVSTNKGAGTDAGAPAQPAIPSQAGNAARGTPVQADAQEQSSSEATQAAAEQQDDTPAQPGGPASGAVPVGSKPSVRGRGPVTPAATGAALKAAAPLPFFAVAVPTPPAPVSLPKTPAASGSGPQERAASAPGAPDTAPERTSVSDAALEIRLRDKDDTTPAVPQAAGPAPVPAVELKPPAPELPPLPPAPETAAAQTVHVAPAVAAEVPARPPEPTAHSAPQSSPSTARSTDIEEPSASATPPQPLRSVSLEFSPDGAGDVRLRLSEKSGEVHISLHSADASLTSSLHKGVHELIGSLSSAGYEAEAWTPGQGRQNSQQEPDQRRNRRAAPDASGEEFGDMFQQPIQEIS
jgi:hypothetical protein